MSFPDVPTEAGVTDELSDVTGQPAPRTDFKTVLTYRGADADRLEQVRVSVNGLRIKAAGQIVAAQTDDHEAFSASYDLLTNELGVTRRLSITLVRVSGDTQMSITRDGEGNWLVQTPRGVERGHFDGAEDVDLALSPFFNSLPIRRRSLQRSTDEVDVPAVYVYLPDGGVEASTIHYRAAAQGISVISPVASSMLSVDSAGFVSDYPGLAERI